MSENLGQKPPEALSIQEKIRAFETKQTTHSKPPPEVPPKLPPRPAPKLSPRPAPRVITIHTTTSSVQKQVLCIPWISYIDMYPMFTCSLEYLYMLGLGKWIQVCFLIQPEKIGLAQADGLAPHFMKHNYLNLHGMLIFCFWLKWNVKLQFLKCIKSQSNKCRGVGFYILSWLRARNTVFIYLGQTISTTVDIMGSLEFNVSTLMYTVLK